MATARKVYAERHCDNCGDRFTPKSGINRFCSKPCKKRHENRARFLGNADKRAPKPCEGCGTVFQPMLAVQRYCGPTCREDHRAQEFHLRKKYGITRAQYIAMNQAQGGLCAICGSECSTRLAVDHDHQTGVVRGLLCRRCNIGIGFFRDRPDLALAAARYLTTHGKAPVNAELSDIVS